MKPYDDSYQPSSLPQASERRTSLAAQLRKIENLLRTTNAYTTDGYQKKGALITEKASIEQQMGYLRHWIKSEKNRLKEIGMNSGVLSGHPTALLAAARDLILKWSENGTRLESADKFILASIEGYLTR
ncbi:MAG: hypothetical protein EXS50_01205 [Candidatus Taylorbacteria bacterium]|nr:hypothetical protein [Candidatus Taylorbacteria bacterium]